MLDYPVIILSAILFSSIFSKRKISNFKPLNCEICLSFWITLIYNFFIIKSCTNPLFVILIGGAIAQLTKITNVLLIKLYGNVIAK